MTASNPEKIQLRLAQNRVALHNAMGRFDLVGRYVNLEIEIEIEVAVAVADGIHSLHCKLDCVLLSSRTIKPLP